MDALSLLRKGEQMKSVSKLPTAPKTIELQDQVELIDPVEEAKDAVKKIVASIGGKSEASVELDTVMIEIPLLPIEGYVRKRVDVTFTSAEAHALKSVRNALEAKSALLANGKNVTTVSDAVRWIVQQIMV